MNDTNNIPTILIVEDDPDQMRVMVHHAQSELKKLIDDENCDNKQKELLKRVGILKIDNVHSLRRAVSIHKNVLLALLDCRIPDAKGRNPHDQLVKTNHRITGQHKSVDIISRSLPNTPIILLSSLYRFKQIVGQYYKNKHDLQVKFIRKDDQPTINQHIAHHLSQHPKVTDRLSSVAAEA